MTPRVSVITPAFNAARTLERWHASLVAQTFGDWEAIVVDDGSTDATPRLVHAISKRDPRVRLISQRNMRQAAARNAGIAAARGEYIALLDADDEALPQRFEKQVRYLDAHPDVTVLGTATIDVDWHTGGQVGITAHPEDHATLSGNVFTYCPFSTSTVMGRSAFFKASPFDRTMPPCEDHDLWLRSRALPGVRYANLSEPLVRYWAKRYMPWSHYRQMHRMFLRRLVAESRLPWSLWYALRPFAAALVFNPLNRKT